jgi:hypothetical protein
VLKTKEGWRMSANHKPFTLYTELKGGRVSSTDYTSKDFATAAAVAAQKAGGYQHIFVRQYGVGAKQNETKTVWEWKAR